MWGLMGPGEKCVSALLGEGKPWKVLDWLPLRPCPPSSQPRGSGGSVRCRDPADFQARGSPAPLSSASRDPPPTTQVQGKQARTGARGVRSPGTMRCLSFGASSAAERGDGNLPGYLRIEFYGPWMVPVPGPGVETERAPVPVVPAVTKLILGNETRSARGPSGLPRRCSNNKRTWAAEGLSTLPSASSSLESGCSGVFC